MKNKKFCTLIKCPHVNKGYVFADGWKCENGSINHTPAAACYYFQRNKAETIDYEYLKEITGTSVYKEPIQVLAALVKSKKV